MAARALGSKTRLFSLTQDVLASHFQKGLSKTYLTLSPISSLSLCVFFSVNTPDGVPLLSPSQYFPQSVSPLLRLLAPAC